jgi:hypothetical protein
VLRGAGRPGAAAAYGQALRLAEATGDGHQRVRALDGLGHLALADGDPGLAAARWQQADDGYAALGLPAAVRLRERVRRCDRRPPGRTDDARLPGRGQP